MKCPDFKDLIAERVAGELTPELKAEMESHEKTCSACQQAVADWRQMESLLRSSWPAQEPRRSFFLPVSAGRVSWFDTARTWFGAASMAVVTACLLLLVLFRPSMHIDRSQLSINFAPTRTESGTTSPQTVTEAQVQAWVQEALAQAGAQRTEKESGATAAKGTFVGSQEPDRVAQVAVQVEMLKENQASLWQQVQQHGLYLQSSWHSPSNGADLSPQPRSLQP